MQGKSESNKSFLIVCRPEGAAGMFRPLLLSFETIQAIQTMLSCMESRLRTVGGEAVKSRLRTTFFDFL